VGFTTEGETECVLTLQSQLKIKEVQVKSLETQAAKLRDVDPDKEQVLSTRKVEVEERFNKLVAPLVERRQKLDQFKRVQQVCLPRLCLLRSMQFVYLCSCHRKNYPFAKECIRCSHAYSACNKKFV